uniref:Lipase domain-containing protein n=1 Tax=Ascaris lumbricoides TaxID=6252 RepID=A0A9J2PG89_ASCLU
MDTQAARCTLQLMDPHQWWTCGTRAYRALSSGRHGITLVEKISQTERTQFQLHDLIAAVARYTESTVDVIGYSGGALIARKAILGGICPDNGDNIGSNLTLQVATFISVGGANHGIEKCPSDRKLCNPFSSLNCRSKLVQELNAQKRRFEGNKTFAIYSVDDHNVGRNCCGIECANLEHASDSFVLHQVAHSALFTRTLHQQFQLVSSSRSEVKNERMSRLHKAANSSSSESLDEAATASSRLNTTSHTAPKNYKTMEKNEFDPSLVLFFVFIALAFFLFKFLSRCLCDRK